VFLAILMNCSINNRPVNDHRAAAFALAWLIVAALCFASAGAALAAESIARFPPPDFGPDYVYPHSSQTPARAGWLSWLDTAMLFLALGLTTFVVLVGRSRRALVWLSIGSLAYFGFYRKGCVCPIGATQNVAQALFDSSYVLPVVVILFFFAPLLLALIWGRVFCGGVCPFGALQDLVLLKPIRLPRWLDDALSRLRYVYLGLAMLFAATGAGYLICEYDPFVGFFRMSGRFHILVWSFALLFVAMFVGRPYCRFLCPYGALLGLASRFSLRRVTITPDRCVVCGLCREACPYGAIYEADDPTIPRHAPGKTLLWVWLFPVVGALIAWHAAPALARGHYMVQVAERVWLEESRGLEERTLQSEAFRATGLPPETAYRQAAEVQASFRWGAPVFGAWCGLVAAMTILRQVARRRRWEYEAGQADCLACARCYMACPVEHERLGLIAGETAAPPGRELALHARGKVREG